jgi:hypothetical protein
MTDAEARIGALPARAMRKIRFSTKTGQTRNPGRNFGSNRIGFGVAAGIKDIPLFPGIQNRFSIFQYRK